MNTSPGITFSPGFKRLLIVLAFANCLIGIYRMSESFFVPEIYKKDFIQEYLMAKAIINGVNPYLPLPELAGYWLVEANHHSTLKHPTPHTPFFGLLSVPFAFLSYKTASIIWLILELFYLSATIVLLLHSWGKTIKPVIVIIALGLALGWAPIIEGIWFGQSNTCLLLLLVGTWLAFRTNKDWLGGTLLGAVLVIKLIAWPIIIFLALRHRWRAVMAAAIVMSSANLIAIGVLGIHSVKNYYLEVAPSVAALYRVHDCNISTWTVGERLFGGIGHYSFTPPLWSSPPLAIFFTYFTPLLVLLIGFGLALRAPNFESSFWLLVGVSILVSPIAWTHYLILVMIPMGFSARQLWVRGNLQSLILAAFCIGLPLSITGGGYLSFSRLTTSQNAQEGISLLLSTRILPFLPAPALIGLCWLYWRLAHPTLSNE